MTATASDFVGKHVHAIAGIGHPARFFNQLRAMGLQVIEHPYPDHHPYRPEDLQFADAEAILMTEKDAVKCVAFDLHNAWYLSVTCELAPAFGNDILQQLKVIANGRKAA
jgi:tetraacyldisaccharide 4'-kinase